MDEAYRFTFEIDGDSIALKSVRRLTMRVPPGQSPREFARNLAGSFVELRGAEGEPLYRREISALLSNTVEYPTGDPERPFGRVKVRRKGVVSVLVPVRKGGRSVAIVETVGRPASKGSGLEGGASRELVAVSLPEQGNR